MSFRPTPNMTPMPPAADDSAAPSRVASHARTSRQAWLAWIAICVIWGTTYLFIKIALETIPPFLMGGLRYAAAGVILAAALRAGGRPLPDRAWWRRLAVLGCLLFLFGNGGVVWGAQFLPSGLTAVLIATNPFWMVGVDAARTRGRQLFVRQWAGLLVGFAGIVLLVWPDITAGGSRGRGFTLGVVSLQIACMGFSIGSIYTRRHVLPGDVMGSAALQMFFGGLCMLAVGTLRGEWASLSFTTRTSWSLAYLTLAGSVVGFAAYSYALRHLSVAIVSLYTYVNPVIAVALGTLLLDEPFHMRMVLAAVVIVAGILIVGPESQPQSGVRAQGSGVSNRE
jgi:drug/metabolite transporter (DMT)-like permease